LPSPQLCAFVVLFLRPPLPSPSSVFSLYGHGHPRDLHSFPTRRSSDLISAESAAMINDARKSGGRVVCVGTTSVRTLESASAEEDRKSTRLNSSHVSISYAVFCLKKKKKKKQKEQERKKRNNKREDVKR